MRRKTHTSNLVCWPPLSAPQSCRLTTQSATWAGEENASPFKEGKTGEGVDCEGYFLSIPPGP